MALGKHPCQDYPQGASLEKRRAGRDGNWGCAGQEWAEPVCWPHGWNYHVLNCALLEVACLDRSNAVGLGPSTIFAAAICVLFTPSDAHVPRRTQGAALSITVRGNRRSRSSTTQEGQGKCELFPRTIRWKYNIGRRWMTTGLADWLDSTTKA